MKNKFDFWDFLILFCVIFIFGSIICSFYVLVIIKPSQEKVCNEHYGEYISDSYGAHCYIQEMDSLVEYEIVKYKDNWRLVK